MKLKDKVALITGCATGIGRSTALLFSKEGAKVVLADISQDAEETVREIRSSGGHAVFVQGDVSSKSYQAGIRCPHHNCRLIHQSWMFSIQSKYVFDQFSGTNLMSPFFTASMAGWTVGMAGLAAYCASKAGVVGLTKCMALELAEYDIRVNCVCPGTIDTTLYPTQFLKHGGTRDELDAGQKALAATIPQGRYGTSAEIAQAVLYLASEESSYVNGQALVVDGGFSNQ